MPVEDLQTSHPDIQHSRRCGAHPAANAHASGQCSGPRHRTGVAAPKSIEI